MNIHQAAEILRRYNEFRTSQTDRVWTDVDGATKAINTVLAHIGSDCVDPNTAALFVELELARSRERIAHAELARVTAERDAALDRCDDDATTRRLFLQQETELAALRRDKERLDWLDARKVNSFSTLGIYYHQTEDEYQADAVPSLSCDSLRAAIDVQMHAAMAKEGGARG